MKKLILLGLATLITFSASAQIEMYTEKPVSQASKPTAIEIKNNLFPAEHPFTFLGGPLDWDKAGYNLIGDTLYSIPEKLYNGKTKLFNIVLSLNKQKDTVRVKQLPVYEKFYVKDIIPNASFIRDDFANKVFVSDTFYHQSYKKGQYVVSEIITRNENSNNKVKIPMLEYFIGGGMPIYILENNECTYFVRSSSDSKYSWFRFDNYGIYPKRNYKYDGSYQVISSAFLSSFISLGSSNLINNKYVGKEVCAYGGYSKHVVDGKIFNFYSEKQVYKVEKVVVKDQQLHIQVTSNVNNEVVLFPVERIFRNYIENSRKDTIEWLDVENFYIEGYEYYGFCLKTDVDSLHSKLQYEYEQEQLALQRKQTQHKEELIKKYGKQYGSLIADGKICVGMTKEMCIAAKGSPCRKSTHTDRYDTTEVWTYHCNSSFYYPIYVTFTNNKITSITDL